MIKVGKRKTSAVRWRYSDVPFDVGGWCKCQEALPEEYDLCALKTKTYTKYGWWTGQCWDGAGLRKDDKIILWKRLYE